MKRTVLVFVPDTFQKQKSGYLEGLHREYEDCDAYYILNVVPCREPRKCVGYANPSSNEKKTENCKSLHFDNSQSKWTLINHSKIIYPNFVQVEYDYKTFTNCNMSYAGDYGTHFKCLLESLRRKENKTELNGKKNCMTVVILLLVLMLERTINVLDRIKPLLTYSATLSHFYDTLHSYKWFLNEVKNKQLLSLKIGNFITCKMIDLTLGFMALRLLMEHEEYLVSFVETFCETIIHNFRDLLIYLMGSPIGLKLNYAFNNSLGKFFFYHISLWRIFIITTHPLIKGYFKMFVLPGAFGLSFQMAMLCDIISIATFHVYCIYVYAARLLHFQGKSLWSLWRLFIGRKYNPLRSKVDSYQYTQHQLYIGTLGFTILLFLLPTTVMYYTVFVIFRLIIAILEDCLMRIRILLHQLPVYVVILWIFQSPRLTGSIGMKVKKTKNNIPSFEANLKMLPLSTVVKSFIPNTIKWKSGLCRERIFAGVI